MNEDLKLVREVSREDKNYSRNNKPKTVTWTNDMRPTFIFPLIKRNSSSKFNRSSVILTEFDVKDNKSSAISSLIILFAIFETICGFVLPISDAFAKTSTFQENNIIEHRYYYETFLLLQYILSMISMAYLQSLIVFHKKKFEKKILEYEKSQLKENGYTKEDIVEEGSAKFSLNDEINEENIASNSYEDKIEVIDNDVILSLTNIEQIVSTDLAKLENDSPYQANKEPIYNDHEGINLYLRLGAVAFGFGVMILDGFRLSDRFEINNNYFECHSHLWIPKHSIHLFFIFWQTYFLFKYHRTTFNTQKLAIRFILIHLAAVNVCQWFKTVIEEISVENTHRLMNESDIGENLKNQDHMKKCHSKISKYTHFLIPCAVEYSLISAAIFYKMYQRVGNRSFTKHRDPHPEDYFSRFSECHKTHRGIFVGLLLLMATIVTVALYFTLDNSELTLLLYQSTEILLLSVSFLTCLLAFIGLRKFEFKPLTDEETFDINLLIVGLVGTLFYDLFLLVPAFEESTSNNLSAMLFVVKAIIELVQSLFQVFFILDTSRKCATHKFQIAKKPARTLVALLLITNLAIWIIDTFELKAASHHKIYIGYFSEQFWTIITHTLLPLIIFFRFHSTVCLSDIWANVYKIKET